MLDLMQDAALIRKVTKLIYWKPKFIRMRYLLEEDDFLQMVYQKLLLNDNYKKYSDKYSKNTFLFHVVKNVAVTYIQQKKNHLEFTILDSPHLKNSDNQSVLFSKYLTTEINTDILDTKQRIKRISASMPEKESHYLYIRYNNKLIPFSISRMFDLFVHLRCTKAEMKRYIINGTSNAPISRMGFNPLWDNMISCIEKELSR